jgi:hypothetical protein
VAGERQGLLCARRVSDAPLDVAVLDVGQRELDGVLDLLGPRRGQAVGVFSQPFLTHIPHRKMSET